MPAQSSQTGRSAAADKKIKRAKKKPRVILTGPTKATKKVQAPTRPAPVSQPGPFTDAERKKVARNEKTPQYKKALKVAHQQKVQDRARRKLIPKNPVEATERAQSRAVRNLGKLYLSDPKGYERRASEHMRQRYLDYVDGDESRLDPKRGFYKPGTTVPPETRAKQEKRELLDTTRNSNATMAAPVLKALEQTTRPLHGLAAAERSVIKSVKKGDLGPGKVKLKPLGEAGKAFVKGVKNEDKSTTRDVLKDVGVHNKAVLAVGGFTGDVLGDPLTYVSFGMGSVAKKAALDAAKAAEKKALAAGLTKEQAERMGHRAARQAAKKSAGAESRSGVTVKFGGREVPGVQKATAKAAGPARKVKNRVKAGRTGRAARSVAADVNPNVAPAGVAKETSDRAIQATRTARAKTNQGQRQAVHLAHAIRAHVGESNYQRVVDAIEAGKVKELPPELRGHAKRLSDRFKHIRRVQRRAGIGVADVAGVRRVKVPAVTADIEPKREALRGALNKRGKLEAKKRRASAAQVPAREEFISKRAKADPRDTPTVEGLSANLKPGKKGISIEDEFVRIVEHGTRKPTGEFGRVLPGTKTVVARDASGKVIGAMQMFVDGKKVSIVSVAVDPAHRGKGLASSLVHAADQAGYDLRHAAAHEDQAYTEAGAALAHKNLAEDAKNAGKLNAQEVRDARAAIHRAEEDLTREKANLRQQRLKRRKAERLNATLGGRPKGYVPRQIVETVEQEAKGKPGVGRRVIKPGSSKARTEKRRLADVRDEKPGLYREDLHALAAERLAEGTTSAARADLNRELADLGEQVKRGHDISLGDGEAVFHVKGSDIREVTDPKELDRAARPLEPNKKGTKLKGGNKQGGRYVVLNKDVVKRAIEGSQPTLQGPGIVHGLDKITVGFKRLAIATPGFHVRNLVGDLQNAYLGQPAHRLPANMRRASKVLRAHGATEKAARELAPADVGRATVKTGKYGDVTYDEVAKQLAQRGAFRSGYISGELRELSKSGGVSGNRVARTIRKGREKVGQTRVAQGTKNAVLAREDLPRLATAMEALRRGASWDEATRAVADLHFDYQHLTNFERQIARRALPFYTWSARNIPLQAKKYVTRPGKYANYQKLRENAAATVSAQDTDPQTKNMYRDLENAGVKLPGGWERYLSEWEQRNAGVPVSWKGSKFTISLGLPLSDLNEAPGAAGVRQLNEYYQKGMSLVGPVPKDVVEYFENHSFFFRDEIEREHSPLVAAPGYVAGLPKGLRGKLGVTKIIDKASGKRVWAWPGKMDYLAKAVPGTPNYVQQLATGGSDRRGKSTTGKVLGFLGVKAVPIDATRNAVNLAYARMDEIAKAKAALNQQGVNADHPNSEYTKLLGQEKILRGITYQGKAAQGYKVLPKQGGPSKVRVRAPDSGGFFGGSAKPTGGGGSFFGGGGRSSSSASSGSFFGD